MKALRWLAIALLCVAWLLLLFRLDSIPPGFQHDQMFDSLNALRVVGGEFPLYFPANFGVAPGFMYAAAAVFRMTDGHYVWALRFTSAMLATVGLAVSLSFARRYLRPAPALFAAALMAGSYWFLFGGRVGLEAISLLPLALACFYCLHRAQERPRLRLYLLAGALGGAAIYTYTASRTLFALPALLLSYEAAAALIARARGRRVPESARTRMAGLLVALAAMLVVSAPLLIYVATHPLEADRRFRELAGPLQSLLAGNPAVLLAGVVETVRAVLVDGSPALPYHYNLPGRPILQPVWAVFFVIGLSASIIWIRDRNEFFLLSVLALGLAPSLLTSSDAILMRSIFALPLLYIVAVRGLLLCLDGAKRFARRRHAGGSRSRAGSAAVVAGAFVAAALLVWQYADNARAYFDEWARDERTQRIYNADFRLAARYLDDRAGDAEIFIGSDRMPDLDSRTYELYEPRRSDVAWFGLPGNPPLPSAGCGVYLGPTTADLPPALSLLVDAGAQSEVVRDTHGTPLLWAVHVGPEDLEQVGSDFRISPVDPPIQYESTLRLDAAGWRDEGNTATLVTQWSALGPWPHAPAPGMPLLQPKAGIALTDAQGYRWAQVDAPILLPVHTARPGAPLLATAAVPLPADMPSGTYEVTLSLYDDEGGPLRMAEGDASLRLAPIPVATVEVGPRPLAAAPASPYPVEIADAGELRPLGRWEAWDRFVAGASTAVRISWQATKEIDTTGLTFRTLATGPDGVIQWEQTEPASLDGAVWEGGRPFRLTHEITPPEGEPGSAVVRLEVCAQKGDVVLGCAAADQVTVVTQPAIRALPAPPQTGVGAQFGESLLLAGYDLSGDGLARELTLYWQVIAPPESPLKRFAHLVGAGDVMLAQSDAPLTNGELPVTAWRPGEYVVDRIELSAADGQGAEAICVGLYDAATEARLTVRTATGEAAADNRLCFRMEQPQSAGP